MYEVEIEYGNGYSCHCCRDTWTGIEEFDTYEEAIAWVAEKTFKRDHSERFNAIGENVNDDFYIKRIYRVTDDDGIDQEAIKELQKEMEVKLKKRESTAEAAKKKKAAAAKRRKEANEKKKFKELKKKYEGETA